MSVLSEISANRTALLDAIAEAARTVGREPGDTTLVAVSKRQPDARIDAALAAGQRVFGENRVQEAQAVGPDGGRPIPISNCV